MRDGHDLHQPLHADCSSWCPLTRSPVDGEQVAEDSEGVAGECAAVHCDTRGGEGESKTSEEPPARGQGCLYASWCAEEPLKTLPSPPCSFALGCHPVWCPRVLNHG